jgi:hypothetical protein
MTDAMFELPSTPDVRKLVIDADYALEKLSRSKLGQLKAA